MHLVLQLIRKAEHKTIRKGDVLTRIRNRFKARVVFIRSEKKSLVVSVVDILDSTVYQNNSDQQCKNSFPALARDI